MEQHQHDDAELQHYADVRQETERVSGWHMDRTIPVALVFMIFMQTVAAIWWASNLSSRVQAAESSISQIDTTVALRGERITRLETMLEGVGKKLDHIDNQLDELALFVRGIKK